MNSLGSVLRARREAASLSLRALAAQMSLAPSYISDIERDLRVPSEQTIRIFARVFSLSFDELMTRAGRLSNEVDRYLRTHPNAGLLLQRLAIAGLSETQLESLIKMVEQMRSDSLNQAIKSIKKTQRVK